MIRLSDKLKVNFFEGTNPITKKCPEDSDPSIEVDLTTTKGSNVLKILMESDIIELKNTKYKVVERQFVFDESTLNIKVVKKRYLHL